MDYNDVCPASEYGHSWVAGMMVVDPEDLATIAATRMVECEKCEYIYPTSALLDDFSEDKYNY